MRFTFYARGEVETCSSVLDVSIRTTVKPSIHALEILPVIVSRCDEFIWALRGCAGADPSAVLVN
jgi:hypothetical protein